jgi:glycerophosphoryl diester phosphodiesterase
MRIKNLLSGIIAVVSVTVSAQHFDIQAHRGGMALYPENTIVAMLNAMDWGVQTLEVDLCISADKKVVVSHEPYMDHRYVTTPGGKSIAKPDEKNFNLYTMPYDSIRKYDSGLKGDPRFTQRKKMEAYKPLLSELMEATENYAKENGLPLPHYNIEIKSSVKNDNVFSPEYREFTDLVMEVLVPMNIRERISIQSFDTRTLNYLNEKYPDYELAYLVGKQMTVFEEVMKELSFVPTRFSPDFNIVDKKLVKKVHALGMKIVPWTVDTHEDIQKMIDLRVDGLITNFPDRAVKLVHFSPKSKKMYQQIRQLKL